MLSALTPLAVTHVHAKKDTLAMGFRVVGVNISVLMSSDKFCRQSQNKCGEDLWLYWFLFSSQLCPFLLQVHIHYKHACNIPLSTCVPFPAT